jgi:hypothetical protein
MGNARVATRNGLAFVARQHGDNVWHGYPEAWDKIDARIKNRWLCAGLVTGRDLRRLATRETVARVWREHEDAE